MWPPRGVHQTEVWQYLANLAYGVTTTRDPQTSTPDVFAYADMVDAGEIPGPRIYATGPGVFAGGVGGLAAGDYRISIDTPGIASVSDVASVVDVDHLADGDG
jgi:hypothetical protein